MKLSQLFKKQREQDAFRLYNIAKEVNINERIRNIADLEYRKMVLKAEEAAVNGETSIVYDVQISELNTIYFNRIIYRFIDKLNNNGFRYSRSIGKRQTKFNIYFSKRAD